MPIDLTALWPDLLLPFAWVGLVGLVFLLAGAAGGILASFGLISVLGLTDANQVKPMAQVLTLATPLVAVPSYLRQCWVVLGLGLILASGGLLGALMGSRLSMHYLPTSPSSNPCSPSWCCLSPRNSRGRYARKHAPPAHRRGPPQPSKAWCCKTNNLACWG